MAVIGTLIAESLRPGAVLEDVVLMVHKIARDDVGDIGVGQPLTWTFLDFEAAEEDADRLVAALEQALSPVGGWYCDFRTDAETFVVYSACTFRYPRGEVSGRMQATAHGRQSGVPEAQLDWPE